MSSTQRILLCTDYLPPSDGGVEQVVQELSRRLAQRGYDVGVYTLAEPGEDVSLSNNPDIDLYTSKKIDLTETIGLQSAVSPQSILEFRDVLQEYDPDIVHIHNRFFFTSYVALLYLYVYEFKLVTTMHLGDIQHIEGIGGTVARALQAICARALVRQSDAVICVSDAVATVAERFGASHATVVRNAVDIDAFSVAEPSFNKRLLYVGRLVRNNGPQDLINAVPDILAVHPDTTIDIVGTGTLRPDLETRTDELGVGDSVTFHGFVDDLPKMYERADVFCRPSYSEGLPLTLLESMATYNVPVVTPVAGTQEVVTEETGRFVNPRDPSSIASVINELFEQPETVMDMAHAARTLVEDEFTWDERTADVIRVYDAVSEGDITNTHFETTSD